ncbi:carph-isopro domain-containing protein [Sphingomonas sp. PB4P5]|uniref:carph-isopro domain-containing protein n=1 Tax=Parasphingomonas puruogangriensis TaxID=3096155 RepID=UPI002FCB1AF9
MHSIANQIIDALGGTTAVSRMTDAPLSTVHSWRKNGIPRSRLAHLRLVAALEKPGVDIDAVAASATLRPADQTSLVA